MSAEANVLAVPSNRMRSGLFALVLYCVGHFFIDMYSGAMGAFQPILLQKLHFSLAEAGILGGIIVFSGSFVQPVYGYLSDRFHSRMFSVLAPAVAGIFISCLGFAPNFQIAAMLIFIGGAGIASFHPQASARATLGIESNRGRWMAVYISAGSLGLAAGPSFFTSIAQGLGIGRSWLAAFPGILVTVVMFICMRGPDRPEPHAYQSFDLAPLKAVKGPLTLLALLVLLRSGIQIVFGQFLPLYLIRERGFELTTAAYALSMFQVAGALGGFAGGHLTDRFGGRQVILWSTIGSIPLLAMFFFTHGLTSMIGLWVGGLVLLCTVPVNVLMGQELAPKAAGTVSALMMGFAWGLGGLIFVPAIGALSDRLTMQTTMSSMIVFPAIGIFLALKLPRHLHRGTA
ncbi:MAG: MFS transporter [Acidobacteriia bacterium]|nr:MFS transporter [Terriglobia bacterium]